jgi:manganese-dependent inorganic pyrophosphatase
MITDGIITFGIEDYLENVKKTVAKTGHRDFPVVGASGAYLGMISRRYLLDARRKRVIMVDHNEKTQAIAGIEEAEILEIIDHHRLGNIETLNPVYFRNQPVGSTSTIIYLIAKENGITFDREHAGLLCSGIISDTLLFRSPTTTQTDRDAAAALAPLAGLDAESYAAEMFHAGSLLDNDDPERMILRALKTYRLDAGMIGIGQINFMDDESLAAAQENLADHLEAVRQIRALDMIFVLLTDISASNSLVIFSGGDAGEVIEEAFEKQVGGGDVLLEGVVSRKKQFVPEILAVLQS